MCLSEINLHLQTIEYQRVKYDLQIKHVFPCLICKICRNKPEISCLICNFSDILLQNGAY